MKLRHGLLVVVVTSALTACGGGGGSVASIGIALKGKVVDGYVKNALVTLDINDDRICQAAEPTTITDAQGNFTFSPFQNPSGASHMTCASGGTDIATNLPFVGQLLAPPGVSQITPLTSLIMAQINSDPTLTKASPAELIQNGTIQNLSNTLASNLGITYPSNGALAGLPVDLLNIDPVADATMAPSLLQATAAAQVLMQQTTAAVGAATSASPAQTNQIYLNAAQALAAHLFSPAVTSASKYVFIGYGLPGALGSAGRVLVDCNRAPGGSIIPPAQFAGINTNTPGMFAWCGLATALDPATVLSVATNQVVAATVTNVAKDPIVLVNAPAVAANAASLAPTSVAAFVAPLVSSLVTAVANTPSATLASLGSLTTQQLAQSNVTIANATRMVVSLLTNTVVTGNTPTQQATLLTNLAALGNAVQTQLNNVSGVTLTTSPPVQTATANIAAAIKSATTGVFVPTAAMPVITAASIVNLQSLADSFPIASLMVNGVPSGKSANGTWAASTAVGVGIQNATLNLGIPGYMTPGFNVYAFGQIGVGPGFVGVLPVSYLDIGFSVISTTAGDKRQFIGVLNNVGIIPDPVNVGAFSLSMGPPFSGVMFTMTGTTFHGYGVNKLGNAVNVTINNPLNPAGQLYISATPSSTGTAITIDVVGLLTALGQANPAFNGLLATKGTFVVDMAISHLQLVTSPAVMAPSQAIQIPGDMTCIQALWSPASLAVPLAVPVTQSCGVTGSSQTVVVSVN